jgi:hypothetical protein
MKSAVPLAFAFVMPFLAPVSALGQTPAAVEEEREVFVSQWWGQDGCTSEYRLNDGRRVSVNTRKYGSADYAQAALDDRVRRADQLLERTVRASADGAEPGIVYMLLEGDCAIRIERIDDRLITVTAPSAEDLRTFLEDSETRSAP